MTLRLLKYIAFGIFFVAAGEFLVNVIAGGSLVNYVLALILYSLLLVLGYGAWRISDKVIKPKWLEVLLSGLFFGFVGLMAEWFIIGNSPWINPGALQPAMFAWWAGVFIVPRIFIEDNSFRKIKAVSFVYHVAFSAAYIAIGIFVSPIAGAAALGFGMLVWLPMMLWYIRKKRR